MARGSGTVTVNILGKADKLRQALDQADKDLAGFGGKLDDFGKKTMVAGAKFTAGLTVPIIGGLGLATKAAAEDAAAQEHLAETLRNTTGATDAQVAAVEEQIGKMMKVSTFADDELRPAFETLVRETRDVQDATGLMNTAMDLAAAKNISVEAAAQMLVKAHNGQTRALRDLGVETKNAEGEAASFGDVMADVNKVVGGSAQAAAETTAGKMKNLNRDFGELVEQLGVSLMPILEKLVGWLEKAADWFGSLSSETQTAILIAAGFLAIIGPLTTAIGALSVAVGFLAANPVVALVAVIAALTAGLVIAYQKSETFRYVVNAVFEGVANGVSDAVGWILGLLADMVGGLAKAAEAASHLPFIGDKFDGIADSLRGAERDLNSWAESAHEGIDLITSDAEAAEAAFRKLGLATANIGYGGGGGGVIVGSGPVRARAAGGPVWPGEAFLVGEQGPELFVPGQAGTVVPNGAVGGTTTIVLQLDGRTVTEVVFNGLLEKQRRTGNLGFEAA